MAHTLGPWNVLWPKFDSLIVDAEERVIASVSFNDHEHKECEANTYLIAAAPELLAACQEVIAWFGRMKQDQYEKLTLGQTLESASKNWTTLTNEPLDLTLMMAAIAKARRVNDYLN